MPNKDEIVRESKLLLRKLKASWTIFNRNSIAVLGLTLTLGFLVIACLAPWISPYDPMRLTTEALEGPSVQHLMGTDDLGRDIFSGILYGSRISILVGILSVVTSIIIAVPAGVISGYCGGKVDDLLMRIAELFQVIPKFFLAVVLSSVIGPTIWNVIFVIGILSWPVSARLIRAEFLSLRERDFVLASRSIGSSKLNVIFSEIFPNAISPLIVNASLEVGHAIVLEASLSFLGLSDPSVLSWGRMIKNAMLFLRGGWWYSVFPGLAIFLMVLGLNLVGDGLNDALNPKLRER